MLSITGWHAPCVRMGPMNRDHRLRVLLVRTQGSYWARARRVLVAAGCEVEVFSGPLVKLEEALNRFAPEVVLIAADAMERDTLESVCLFGQSLPRPMVVFTEDTDPAKIRRAVASGVAAYVVAGLDASRVRPIIEAALARFEATAGLRAELERTRRRLADREAIDQAKRLLMAQGMDEKNAHAALQRLAMDHGISKAAAARRLLARAKDDA